MTDDEAARAGVETRRPYFRVENGKASMSAAPDKTEWFRLASVDLGNGDSVGVVTLWRWPDALDGVTVSDLRAVQTEIAGGRSRESPQAKDWAGHAVAKVLGLDGANKAHRAKIAGLLKTWIGSGALAVVEGLDDRREKRSFIEVGTPADD
jgi:hypothetical protein